MRILTREQVRAALGMAEAIELMRHAFIQLSTGEAIVPVRSTIELQPDQGRALLMPVYSPADHRLGLKLVSIMDNNPARGLPYIQAMVILIDTNSGQPLALMDGEYLTGLRTGAASGLATDLLARQDATVAAVVGAGAQARFQIEAVTCVRQVEQVLVLNRTQSRSEALAQELAQQLDVPVTPVSGAEELENADVICTATTASQPVLHPDHLKSDVHINAIGAYKPTMCEVPPEVVACAKLVVDHRESSLSEAGDVIQPIRHGRLSAGHIHAELGEIAAGLKSARTESDGITLFKSVGNAIQDLVAANQVLVNAEKLNIGSVVKL